MVDIARQLDGLLYKEGETFFPLPQWGKFYISLGILINQKISNDSKLVTALAVPIRAYCSVLISFGYIIERAKESDKADNVLYAETLKTFPHGTPVILRSQIGKRFKGIYEGFVMMGGQAYFIIKTDKKTSTRRHVRFEDSRSIEVLDQEDINLPQTQSGRPIAPSSNFATTLIGTKSAESYVSSTKLEEVIIGPKNLLKREISKDIFASKNKETGHLQDILRTREFQARTSAYRSIVISDVIKYVPVHSNIIDPPLTIFDGSQSFLKWRNHWRGSNWVIVLDRTENQFESAVEQLNKEYIQHRVDKPENLVIYNIPEGIEIMVFSV